jgi:hypothetical protein
LGGQSLHPQSQGGMPPTIWSSWSGVSGVTRLGGGASLFFFVDRM